MRASYAMSTVALAALGLAASLRIAQAATWNLTDTVTPSGYNDAFDYFNLTDPTNGLVLYQSQTDAVANNLTGVSNGRFYMRVDTTEVQTEGRRSVRLSSKKSYSDGIYVLNVSHIPTGCAAWPAFWTVTENLDSWPTGGEIDILENANDLYNGALSSLHTQDSCILPSASESGTLLSNNCSVYTPDNSACSVVMNGTSTPTWGSRLNAQGGGLVAMERSFGQTGNGVRVWFWAQGNEPSDLKSGSQGVDPSTWGTPGADFNVADNCHTQFGPHKITFDITLCGQFGDRTYNQSSCNTQYPFCAFQVGQNGSSFNESYWSIGALRVFATGGDTDNAANAPNTSVERNTVTSAALLSLPVQIFSLTAAALGAAAMLLV